MHLLKYLKWLKMNPKIKLTNIYKNTIKPFKKAIEDVIVSSIPQIVTVLIGLVISVLIARGLGPYGMGEYALIISIPTLIIGLSDLGINQTAIRFASKAATHSDNLGLFSVLRWAFKLRIFLIIIMAIVGYLLAPLICINIWHDENLTFLLRLSLLIGIFTVISHIPYIYFQSLKRFRMNTIIAIVQIFVTFLGILLIAVLNLWSLEFVVLVSIVASSINAIIFIFSVPKSVFYIHDQYKTPFSKSIKNFFHAPSIKYESDSFDSSKIHSFAFYMLLSSLAVMIMMQSDVWFLGYFLAKNQVGIYNVAKYYVIPITVIFAAVNTALWPRASSIKNKAESVEMLITTFKFSVLIAVGCLIYSIFAPLTLPLIFGTAYSGGILLGVVLCFRWCISILVCPISIIGYNFGLVKVYWLVNIIQLIVFLIMNILLIPLIGPMGSAISLLITEIIGDSIVGLILWREIKKE